MYLDCFDILTYELFSTFVPGKMVPSVDNKAAPTRKLEYGAYLFYPQKVSTYWYIVVFLSFFFTDVGLLQVG